MNDPKNELHRRPARGCGCGDHADLHRGAKAGDTIALRLVMERVAPLRRGRPVQFELPPIDKASDLAIALGGILRAAASGALTPEEAATVAGIVETKRRAVENVELENRLNQLEKRLI